MYKLLKQVTKTLVAPVPTFSLRLSQPTTVVSQKAPDDSLIKGEKGWALFLNDLLSTLETEVYG